MKEQTLKWIMHIDVSIMLIRKTQKRANALQNISIPEFERTVKFISESLDEKDREEFSRQKVIKTQKNKQERLKKEQGLE